MFKDKTLKETRKVLCNGVRVLFSLFFPCWSFLFCTQQSPILEQPPQPYPASSEPYSDKELPLESFEEVAFLVWVPTGNPPKIHTFTARNRTQKTVLGHLLKLSDSPTKWCRRYTPPPVALQGVATPLSQFFPQFPMQRRGVAATPPPNGPIAPHPVPL